MLLRCDNLTKSFGERKLFTGLSFSVDKGRCLAILGRNGCGKSTLLKMIVGEDTEFTGVIKKEDVRLSYLHQQDEAVRDTRSGGERTRDRLNAIFEEKPSIMILDEPTNHLDMETMDWLTQKLKAFKGALVLVSHDRYLIDNIATDVLDLNTNPPRLYKGNYSGFLEQKEILLKTNENIIKKTEDKIRHEEEVIKKLRSFNREKSIKRADSRQKMLEKIERPDKITDDKTRLDLILTPGVESGKDVLMLSGVEKSFGDRMLFSEVSFDLRKGEHVGIIGANGTGKSTIFNIIRGTLNSDSGDTRLGTNVSVGFYDQTLTNFHEEATLFDEIRENFGDLDDTRLRNTLAAFGFYEDDVYKKVLSLSGGEKGRLALAKLMLGKNNLLLLDEPTNHLDIESKEILEDAVNRYAGTVLFISHDRYFLNRCADRILELREGKITGYLGNYDEYKAKRQELIEKGIIQGPVETPATIQNEKTVSDSRLKYEEEKRKKALSEKRKRDEAKLMERMEKLETMISEIDLEIANPANASDHVKLTELTEKRNALDEELLEVYEKLEEIME